MNFELGERVKCVGDVFNKGAIGIVSKVAIDYIEVKFNDREIYGYPCSYLEKIDLERKEGDLISRQAVLNALKEHRSLFCDNTPETFSKLSYAEKSRVDELDTAIATIINLPSVENKAEWVLDYRDCGVEFYRCSKCNLGRAVIDGDYYKSLDEFKKCPICGANMRVEETDYDYERAIEQLEHDILYEPTFNQDDGSM